MLHDSKPRWRLLEVYSASIAIHVSMHDATLPKVTLVHLSA